MSYVATVFMMKEILGWYSEHFNARVKPSLWFCLEVFPHSLAMIGWNPSVGFINHI